MNYSIARLVTLLGLVLNSASLYAQSPEWIWHDNHGAGTQDEEVCYLRKTFTLAEVPARADLMASCDNEMEVYLNGHSVASGTEWQQPAKVNVARWLQAGENVLAARAQNHGGAAAFVARLQMTFASKTKLSVVTDASWISSRTHTEGWQKAGLAAADWTRPTLLGKLGVEPWGNVFASTVTSNGKSATPAESLLRPAGFNVELLHTALADEGSWICMTTDPKGRLIISPQDTKQRLLRVTLTDAGQVDKMERIELPISGAMGLLWAFDSLYVSGIGPQGSGLYRLRDTNQDDQLDELQFLKKFEGGGEHGPHGLVLGPDRKIYVMNGNHTKVPEGVDAQSPHRNYQEDFLLPRQWDAQGHAAGVMAPGGYVARTDAEGKQWDLLLGGFRNSYDFDFSPEGELFTFDSDMEWEWGMPWYRPIRIIHGVSGGEYGWRSGSAKWPGYYADSLPSVVDIGVGSPTGVKFGTGAKFPPKYQRALYAMDWSYGRILAVHLQPSGASYTATFEPFITGKPLNVSDLVVGRDGALYFITGGRGTQSGLYRVTHTNPAIPEPKPTAAAAKAAQEAAAARALRHQLEALHGKANPQGVDFIWPHLNSPDRSIRYAARIALESQDLSQWKARALKEGKPRAGLTALLALARVGGKDDSAALLTQLLKWSYASLAEPQRLELLRTYEVAFARLGRPSAAQASAIIGQLDDHYPNIDDAANRELGQVLIYLEAPSAATKSLVMLRHANPVQEQLFYLFYLRNLKAGWTPALRQEYFTRLNAALQAGESEPALVSWFADVGRAWVTGASFSKQIAQIRADAVALLSPAEKQDLAAVITEPAPVAKPPAPARAFVQDWKTADLAPLLAQAGKGRSFARGKEALNAAQCLACHRFGNEGGAVGPDITAISSRFSRRDLLESITEPSKVISDQYQSTTIFTKNGDDFTGRVVDESGAKVAMMINPLAPQRVEILKTDIARREPSKLSPMPEGLLNALTKEEILDLLAYLESAGRKNSPAFAK